MAFPVPYTSRLGERIQPGQTLTLVGTAHPDGKEIEINLLAHGTQVAEGATEVIFHMKTYLTEGRTVFSAHYGGAWHDQKTIKDKIVKPGERFETRIRTLNDHYDVRVNGKHIFNFKHDATKPSDMVEFFQVKGDVTLENVQWGGRLYVLPWETGFPNGVLHAHQKVVMYAIPKGDWKMDLVHGNGDILFHFNPRFKEKKVVRNSYQGAIWGKEEREGGFPFEKERGFHLTIENAPHSIQIYVDGKHFEAFAHRGNNPNQDYIGMRLDGDVEVTHIEFQ